MKKTIHLMASVGLLVGYSYAGSQAQTLAHAGRFQQQSAVSGSAQKSLREAITDLKTQYKVNILFERRLLDKFSVPTNRLHFSGSVENLLTELLSPFGLTYKRMKAGGYVIIANRPENIPSVPTGTSLRPEEPISSVTAQSVAEPKEQMVQGVVRDADNGQGLPGVNVTLKGTQRGTTTDASGSYKIEVPNSNAVLVFSYIGFESREVLVGSQRELNVSLTPSNQSLSEVVVVGYGQQKRANLTGAVATIENKELKQSVVANLSNAVTGRIPGLITKQASGEPGNDGSTLLIRGVSTSGDNTPLYVIDGIPRGAADFNQLDPNEIESFTILKDAASSAVFGVRGANGVILVTTKRGKSGKTSFSYSMNYGVQQPTRLPKFLGSYDYALLYNEAKQNEGRPLPYTDADLEKFKNGSDPDRYPNTDWFKEVLKPSAPQIQHNLTVNGGTEKARYFISLGYLDQQGLYEQVNFKRYNLRANIDADVTPTTLLSLDVSGRVEDRKFPGASIGDIFSSLVRTPPTIPARYQNGLIAAYNGGGNSGLSRATETGYRRDSRPTVLTRLAITQRLPFVSGLAVRGIVAVDKGYRFNKNWNLTPVTYLLTSTGDYNKIESGAPVLYQEFYQYQSITPEFHITYDRTFGRHDVSGLLLYTQNVSKDNLFSASRRDYPTAVIEELSAGDAKLRDNNGGASASTRQGYVGRVNYAYDGKYLMEANFRYDGSDNFAPGRKFGFFPSMSVGWVLSQENFIKNSAPAIDFAKLRFSYGVLGNDRLRDAGGNDISRYPYLATYNYGNDYVFGGSSPNIVKGVNESGLANPAVTWETATKTDIGLEARFLKGLISLEADYFYQRRSGILGTRNVAVPLLLGATLPVENLSIIDNKGVELSLGHQNKVGKNLTYYVRGNLTYATNKVIFIDEPANVLPGLRRTDLPLNQYFGLVATGLFQTAEEIKAAPVQFGSTTIKPGDIRYADVNGDGKIDNNDRTAIGRSNIPQIIYGLSGGVTYRGFDVSVLFQGAGQVDQYLSEEAAWAFFNGGKVQDIHLDRWTPSNPNATYPRILSEDVNNRLVSSYWVRDASYLRLKNVEIGYNVPKTIASKIRAENIRFYVSGMNLFTLSKLKTLDPENTNARAWAYPQQKLYNVGLNIQF